MCIRDSHKDAKPPRNVSHCGVVFFNPMRSVQSCLYGNSFSARRTGGFCLSAASAAGPPSGEKEVFLHSADFFCAAAVIPAAEEVVEQVIGVGIAAALALSLIHI